MSSSSSSDSDDSSSGSSDQATKEVKENGEEKELRKKKKKKKKHKKDEKKKRKRKKKEKKKKHKKKQKKKKKSKSEIAREKSDRDEEKIRGACDQNAFGSRGILREADYFRMQPEFELWLLEVKHIEASSGILDPRELKDFFKSFAEDFNTVTFPNEKYYSLNKWHRKEEARKNRELRRKLKAQGGKRKIVERVSFNDERERREEQNIILKKKKLDKAYELMTRIDPKKAQDMRDKEILLREMQAAYKMGDVNTVERIKLLIETPEEKMKRYGWVDNAGVGQSLGGN